MLYESCSFRRRIHLCQQPIQKYSLNREIKNGRFGASDMPHRILVVDDHPVVHLGIKALLETERFATIIECPDFRKINLLIGKHRPDAILLDMHMPRFAIERDFRIILRQHPDEIFS